MAKLSVSSDLLCQCLRLPTCVITNAVFDPETQAIVLHIEGPDVPAAEQVIAIFTQTCRFEAV